MIAGIVSYVLDTSVIIYYLRKLPGARQLMARVTESGLPLLSTVTHLEIYQGMQPREEENTLSLLGALPSHPLDAETARRAGELVRVLRSRGISLSLPDAIIAATALTYDAPLVTSNTKHFDPVDGLKVTSIRQFIGADHR